ncbi:unnamed protein product, partial [Didymodactylos carnosus]
VADALASAYEYLVKYEKGIDIDVSRLFIYWNGRWLDQTTHLDDGIYLKSGVDALITHGVMLEHHWPYLPSFLYDAPPPELYQTAKQWTVKSVNFAPHLYTMKNCLANGYPFMFGLEIFNSFGSASHNKGYVPMPDPSEMPPSHAPYHTRSHHALLAVGYDDYSNHFIVRNCWGSEW